MWAYSFNDYFIDIASSFYLQRSVSSFTTWLLWYRTLNLPKHHLVCYPLFLLKKIVKNLITFRLTSWTTPMFEYNRIGTILFNKLVLWTGLEPVIKVYKTLVITALTTWGWRVLRSDLRISALIKCKATRIKD